jgi:hypothetical protein
LWVVEQEGYSVWLVVGVVDGGTPLADKGDTVVAVANKSGHVYRFTCQKARQEEGNGEKVHHKQSLILQSTFSESKDNILDIIIRPSHRIEPTIER